jgi:hypothetical protein
MSALEKIRKFLMNEVVYTEFKNYCDRLCLK